MHKIFGSEDCSRCAEVASYLIAKGKIVNIHNAEWHSQRQEGWKDRTEDFVDFMTLLNWQEHKLPVVYDTNDERFLDWEEIEEMCSDCVDGVCKI